MDFVTIWQKINNRGEYGISGTDGFVGNNISKKGMARGTAAPARRKFPFQVYFAIYSASGGIVSARQ